MITSTKFYQKYKEALNNSENQSPQQNPQSRKRLETEAIHKYSLKEDGHASDNQFEPSLDKNEDKTPLPVSTQTKEVIGFNSSSEDRGSKICECRNVSSTKEKGIVICNKCGQKFKWSGGVYGHWEKIKAQAGGK